MTTPAGHILNPGTLDWTAEPGPKAFERFYRLITDRDELPTVPEVAQRLMQIVNKETANSAELVALLTRDQALAAKLLRLANGAFFALPRPVTDLGHAVRLLGFGTVRDMVMSLSLWGSLGDTDPATRKHRQALWVHCASVGVISKLLAKKIGRLDPGEALSAGLLHDLGSVLLGLRLGTTYWDMLDQAEDAKVDPTQVERDTFGLHHGIVGQYMLQMWALPQTLCDAVGRHHDPPIFDNPVGIAHVVNAANHLVRLVAPEHDEQAGALLAALAPGRLTADMWPMLRDDFEAEQRQIRGLFEAT